MILGVSLVKPELLDISCRGPFVDTSFAAGTRKEKAPDLQRQPWPSLIACRRVSRGGEQGRLESLQGRGENRRGEFCKVLEASEFATRRRAHCCASSDAYVRTSEGQILVLLWMPERISIEETPPDKTWQELETTSPGP
jgi:hypothetical protein